MKLGHDFGGPWWHGEGFETFLLTFMCIQRTETVQVAPLKRTLASSP